MAHQGAQRVGSSYQSRNPSFAFNTSYNGAEGQINDRELRLLELEQDAFDENLLASPPKATRPALGSRLLSSLSNAQPAAAALTRSGSIIHSRAKSLASFVPSFNNHTANGTSPATSPNKLFSDFFTGESAPVRLGIPPSSPSKEREESEFVMDYKPSLTERPSSSYRRKSLAVTNSPQRNQKANWFSRKLASVMPVPSANAKDEILDININTALFPDGPADPLSPHAFNDLLHNATTLLERMQNAYREKVQYIASIKPEIEAQREEAEEAETRAQHLKMQLEDMCRRAQEQESVIENLATQLAHEKAKLRDIHDSRTIRPVRQSSDASRDETSPRRRKRGSADTASDSGFESDLDRDTDSILSAGIPTPRSPPPVVLGPALDLASQRGVKSEHHNLQRRPSPLIGPRSMASAGRLGGGDASWITVERLQGENHDLRNQLDVMQQSLQGCIELVDGAHI